jgi:hypothetical protein
MFGTFTPEDPAERVDYGLVHNLGTFNPVRVAFHEWVGIFRDVTQPGITLRDRLNYCLKPPGWSHDGSRRTSDQIKAAHVAAANLPERQAADHGGRTVLLFDRSFQMSNSACAQLRTTHGHWRILSLLASRIAALQRRLSLRRPVQGPLLKPCAGCRNPTSPPKAPERPAARRS